MRNKQITAGLAALALALSAVPAAAAGSDTPIITFHTSLYELNGAENVFTFYLGASENTYVDVDCGFGKTETEVEMAYFDTDKSQLQGTPVTCTVSSEGIVKVYGDPSKIDYIDIGGCYITSIDWPQMTEVEIMNISHNLFTSLDLSHMTKLQALYANDIPCTEATPFIVGASKPDLQILETSMVEWIDPAFNLTGYPALKSFTSYSTPSLRHVDTNNCPQLLQLSVDATGVEAVDVSKNPNLLILNVSETKVTQLDVTRNPYLTELYAQHTATLNGSYKLTSLDLSGNPELVRLYVAGNRIKDLDLSNNSKLVSFSCRDNLIGALSFDHMPDITLIDVSHNRMDFNTCPVPQPTYSEYDYAQDPMMLGRSYMTGTVLDLTARVVRSDANTEAALFAINRNDLTQHTLLTEEYYSFDNGKVTLKKEYPDSVYLAFRNTIFPDWTMTTTPFMVKSEAEYGKPSVAVTISTSVLAKKQELYIGLEGASDENPLTFTVDFGDGMPVEFTATTSGTPPTPNATGDRKGGTTTVYVPEGVDITALKIADMRLNGIDLSEARQLRELSVTGCSLASIDLKYNRWLRILDLSGNSLSSIDLSEPNGSFLKTMLSDINLADNRLTAMKLVDNYGIHKLNVSNNRLTEIFLQHAVRLTDLDISDNRISEISLTDCELLANLNIAGNLMSELTIPDYMPLGRLDVSRNAFTTASLPAPGICPDYTYAPQADVRVPSKAPSINLSKLNVTVDGHPTVFEWFMADDNTPVSSGIGNNDGRFTFTDPNIGRIYCRISNSAFPALSGENALKTTVVQTAEKPTNDFVTFVTAEDGTSQLSMAGATDGVTIYIDWTGEGDFEQYVLKDTYTVFEAQTVKGATVKCYSYDDVDGVTVFSIYNTKMESMDATKMKSVKMFGLSGAEIAGKPLKLPVAASLDELNLDANGLTSISFETTPNLYSLSLNDNELTTIDVSSLKNLQLLHASANKLKKLTLDNPKLWELSAIGNALDEIDLSCAPAMEQLWLSHNSLSHLDVSPCNKLRVLTIDNNLFDYTSLPAPDGYFLYNYAPQAPLPITVIDGKVDLSSQAVVGSTATSYSWYIDSPYFDDNDMLTGEELYAGEEYTIENGVTTFLKSFHNVMCVMTNQIFPKLYLYTDFVDVEVAGVPDAMTDCLFAVTLNGSEVTVEADVPDGTRAAIHGIDGRMVSSAVMKNGKTVMAAPTGMAIVTVGTRSAKIAVK